MILIEHNNKIIELRETLFWDVDPGNLHAVRSKSLIIERVLTRGNLQEFKQLIRFYAPEELKDAVIKIGYIDKRTLNFISTYLDIPKEEFLCYRKMQSAPAHWNY